MFLFVIADASFACVWAFQLGEHVQSYVKGLRYCHGLWYGGLMSVLRSKTFWLLNLRVALYWSISQLCWHYSKHFEELFFRLSAEPKTLLWLLGVAPGGTLARQLLEDFVLNQCVRTLADKDLSACQHHSLTQCGKTIISIIDRSSTGRGLGVWRKARQLVCLNLEHDKPPTRLTGPSKHYCGLLGLAMPC